MYCNVHMFYKLKLLNQLTDFNELVPLDICNFLHEIFWSGNLLSELSTVTDG
jgi:hypothetical protein